ncbi:MAG: helix-turn-helix transcriptional regulator [Polyangiaceae bacterium]|nr:helix-turn-helix transcriptional regulator [Polyangiaceae bacterium]
MADRLLLALGRRIRSLRHERGLSQEELADRAELHRTYVGGIERGERNPTVRNLAAMARALGVSLSTLLEGVAE